MITHNQSPLFALLFTNLAILLEAITVTGVFSTLFYSALAVLVGWGMDYARKRFFKQNNHLPPPRK